MPVLFGSNEPKPLIMSSRAAPEKGVVGAEGANVEVDVEREGFEEDGEGGFQGCDTGGLPGT